MLLTSESDDLLFPCGVGGAIFTGEVVLLTAWTGGEEGGRASSGTGELKAKLNADWLLDKRGGAEGGGEPMEFLRARLEGGVTLCWVFLLGGVTLCCVCL